MLCREWHEISLTVLHVLVNCHDVPPVEFLTGELKIKTGMKSPLKCHNQPEKNNKGLLESLQQHQTK